MKTLVLIRHAKSSWKEDSLPDAERPLNNRGKRDAPFMGKLLRDRDIVPDLIISSPAVRAMTTAEYIAAETRYCIENIIAPASLYLAEPADILTVLEAVDDALGTVFVVGHNPGISNLAALLSSTPVEPLPTCGIACLQMPAGSWKDIRRAQGELVFLERAKSYFR